MTLTWEDLIIQNISPENTQEWISPWSHLLAGEFSPIFMSKFGDWLLHRPDGTIDELSVIEGTLKQIATNTKEFAALVNRVEWQEKHLLSFHVARLHERGLIPKVGECYGFAPHPIITGKIDFNNVQIMDVRVWQYIAAQSLI